MAYADPAVRRQRNRERVARRKAAGICTKCKSPARPGRTTCEPCAEKRRAGDRARHARAKAEGIPYGGRDPEARRLAGRKRSRRRAEARRAAGLCIRCGHLPPENGRAMCEPCREDRKHAAYYTSIIPSGAGAEFGFRHGPHRLACLVGGGSGISNRYSGLSL